MENTYDSAESTLQHIAQVKANIQDQCTELMRRAEIHDLSKLQSPEKELFDTYTPMLRKTTYQSEEYKKFLQLLKPALDHHYSIYPHHPEHYENGIDGMDLYDIMEMIADWVAAVKRHDDGNILESLEKNRQRFNISDQLYNILYNHITRYHK